MLTHRRTLLPGDVVRPGTKAPYRRFVEGLGEPHIRRRDLAPDASWPPPFSDAHPPVVLGVFAHLTDLHVMDASSPTRLEVLARRGRDERWRDLLGGAFRAQETLTAHAAARMACTVATTTGPFSGRAADLAVVTGDNIDNCQANELANYLAALEGGTVRPAGRAGYEGVQSLAWDDTWYWQPDGDGDRMQSAWGFPRVAGLLDVAARPFDASGLSLDWLACYGNHDALLLGTARPTAAARALAVGGTKPRGSVTSLPSDPLGAYLADPVCLFGETAVTITADAGRRVIDRDDFLAAHFGRAARPVGHGFTGPDGVAYYSYEVGAVTIVMLDTTHPAGYWEGSIDTAQLAWLDGVLAACDARRQVVLVASHHATPSIINTYGSSSPPAAGGDGGAPGGAPAEGARHLAADLIAVLHRHPCVVGWLNGHHHENRVVGHGRDGGGFWEITTSAVIDWPCQARLVEVLDEGDGHLALVTTMIDYDDPPLPDAGGDAVAYCASLHRELAANQSWQRGLAAMEGTPEDRNTMLVVPHPFTR